MTYWVKINNSEEFYITQQILIFKKYFWTNGDNQIITDPGAGYIIYSEKHKTIYWDRKYPRLNRNTPQLISFDDFIDKMENEL